MPGFPDTLLFDHEVRSAILFARFRASVGVELEVNW